MYHYCQWSCCSQRTEQLWSGCSRGAVWWRFCSFWWKHCHFKSGRRGKSFCKHHGWQRNTKADDADVSTQESRLQKENRNESRHNRNCERHKWNLSSLSLVIRVTDRQYTAKKWHSTFGFSRGFIGPNIAVTGERISRVCCQRKKNKKKGTEWQNNFYWQFLEKLQNNAYWRENTRRRTSKAELKQPAVLEAAFPSRWLKMPVFHCCYRLSILFFTGGLSLFIQNSYHSISPI